MRRTMAALTWLFLAATAALGADIRPLDPNEVLYLSGSPAEIGRQHGQATRAVTQQLLDGWLKPKLNSVPWLGDAFATIKARTMENYISDALKTEMHATAEAAGVDYKYLLIANAAPDIFELVDKPFGCSTFVSLPGRSLDGGLIYGRNLDYDDSDILRGRWKATVFATTGKLKVLSINAPGLSGLLTAINEKGVMMSRMTSYSRDKSAWGMPTMLLFREVLEKATSAEHAAQLYLEAKRTVAINIMITDPNDALVLEVARKTHAIRRPNEGRVLYSANHYEHPDMHDGQHERDSRWDVLASRDADRSLVQLEDVIGIIGRTGRDDGNVLATFADYGQKRIIFGSDPEGRGKAAYGTLYSLNWDEAFAR